MNNVSCPLRYHKMEPVVNPVYDKIVDRTDFKKGQDKERAMRLAGDTGGSVTNGVYDFPDGKISPESTPTAVQIALRTGRLDKADVDTLKRVQDKVAKEEQDNAKSEKLKADEKAINDARQSYIDSQTGFDPSSVNSDK